MNVRNDDIVSIDQEDMGNYRVTLWTPSGVPIPIGRNLSDRVAQRRKDEVTATIRQWARVLTREEQTV